MNKNRLILLKDISLFSIISYDSKYLFLNRIFEQKINKTNKDKLSVTPFYNRYTYINKKIIN